MESTPSAHDPLADATPILLRRWHDGDERALAELVAAHLPWLRARVERRLGPFLRARGDADDYLQDVVLDFLRDGPRFVVRDAAQLRALLARIAENTLRDRNDWFRAKRRKMGSNVTLSRDSVLPLDPAMQCNTTPSQHASKDEERQWVRLALELMDGEDRAILVAREYEDRSFVDLGAELGMTPNAVRMRWTRAIARLADVMKELQAGRVPNDSPPA
jgi:RNA polymerase sigma factor (sigma-70 family)